MLQENQISWLTHMIILIVMIQILIEEVEDTQKNLRENVNAKIN
jgi:hypothetical protein